MLLARRWILLMTNSGSWILSGVNKNHKFSLVLFLYTMYLDYWNIRSNATNYWILISIILHSLCQFPFLCFYEPAYFVVLLPCLYHVLVVVRWGLGAETIMRCHYNAIGAASVALLLLMHCFYYFLGNQCTFPGSYIFICFTPVQSKEILVKFEWPLSNNFLMPKFLPF